MDMTANLRIGTTDAAPAAIPAEFGLSVLDWRVVALARTEADRFGARAFRARGAIGRLLDRLTGVEGGVRRLADDRLEALRRFVGLARRRDRGVVTAAAALAALGFAAPTIDLLRSVANQ